jgi:hypothetical protein
MKRTTRSRVCSAVLIMGGMALSSLTPATAQFYRLTKTITWDVTNKAGTAAIDEAHEVKTIQHVFAGDKHKQEHKSEPDEAGKKDYPKSLATAVEGAKYKGAISSSVHADWKVEQHRLGWAIGYPPLVANSDHATADAALEVSLGEAALVEGRFLSTSVIIVNGNALVLHIPNAHAPETAYAESAAAVAIRMKGATIKTVDIVDGKVKIRGAGVGMNSTSMSGLAGEYKARNPEFEANPKGDGRDPIVLSLYDELTGALVAEDVLFQDQFLTEYDGSIEWMPADGLVLSTGAVGAASILFETPSHWVLNPFNGSASLIDGVFSATGDLGVLPWNIFTLGDRTYARLLPSDLSMNFDFDIEVDGLGTPANDLLTVLSADLHGFGQEYDTLDVPEVSSFLCLCTGVLALSVFRVYARRRTSC